MDTYELFKILRDTDTCTGSRFLGVFAADKIPAPKRDLKVQYFICNVDTSDKPGVHWQAVVMKRRGGKLEAKFFCSYGLRPYVPQIVNYLNRYCEKWTWNKVQIQRWGTDVCGHYCILFLALTCRGKKGVIKYLKKLGDDKVKMYLKKYYNKI